MPYTGKTNWQNNEIVAASDMNRIEQGISDADAGLADKVDKVTGKGLSTNDYTTAEKNKLNGIAAGAQVNTVTSVAGRTGAVVVSKSDVGLSNVDNIKQASKTEFDAHLADYATHIIEVAHVGGRIYAYKNLGGAL